MECVSALPSRTKSPEILNSMSCSEPGQHLEEEETSSSERNSETNAYTDESEQEEKQFTRTNGNKCVNQEGAKDWRETSVSGDNHSTNIADSINIADSAKLNISSNGVKAECNKKWIEPAATAEKSGITNATVIPSTGDQSEFKKWVEPADKSEITHAAVIPSIGDQEEFKKWVEPAATAEKSGITNATVIPSIRDQAEFNKWVGPAEKSEIPNATVNPSNEDQAEFNKWVEPAEKSGITNVTFIPSAGDQEEFNKLVEPAEKSGMTNATVILSTGDQAEFNKWVEPAEKSEIANGAIIIHKQSNIIMGVVIPSKSEIIHDAGNEVIETPVNTTAKDGEINLQSMNIVLREIEESSDTIDSSNNDNSSIKVNNISGKDNYRSKNPNSKNKLNISNNEKISNCTLNITELGDRLIKLDLAEDDGLTSTTSNFQRMNICVESEVSDEENASDDDNDDSYSISNDDQDTAFEGDDENDDDDYEGPFEKHTGFRLSEKGEKRITKELAEQEEEYISRNPIAQVRSNDRYHPYYQHPTQISLEPIISADELIQNFTVSENEKNFLSSLPPNLNIDTCPINETQTTNYQDTFCNGDKYRDMDELSMTSDLGHSVVADSPQSIPSPSDSYSDYENVDHLSEFCLFQNIPSPASMPSMSSRNQNTANHVPRKATVNENQQFTYLPASNTSTERSLPALNPHANVRNASPNNNIKANQLTVGYVNNDGVHRKKPVTRLNYSKQLLQNGGTVHVNNPTTIKRKPTSNHNVVLTERSVNVPHQLPVQIVLSQPLANLNIEPRSTTRVSPIQPRQQGPLLCEQDMYRTAAERLQIRSKKKLYSPTDFEWIKLLVNKPGQSPETKHFFIDFLKENNETVMEERVLAHSSYIKSALKNPEIFYMQDPVTGYTPLRIAAFNHYSKPLIARCIADFIVDTLGKKIDFDVDDKGETVLHKLACMGESHVEVLAELLNVKMRDRSEAFDVNKPNINGMTPLMLAVVENFKHSFHTVEQLIKHGARIEAEDKNGRNCLHYAVEKTMEDHAGFEILRKLLQSLHSSVITGKLDKVGHYAAINKCDDHGYTPLHLAIKDDRIQINEQLKIIQLLKEFGSDTKIKCCGHLPLILVKNSDRKEIIKPHLMKTGGIGRPQAVKY